MNNMNMNTEHIHIRNIYMNNLYNESVYITLQDYVWGLEAVLQLYRRRPIVSPSTSYSCSVMSSPSVATYDTEIYVPGSSHHKHFRLSITALQRKERLHNAV